MSMHDLHVCWLDSICVVALLTGIARSVSGIGMACSLLIHLSETGFL